MGGTILLILGLLIILAAILATFGAFSRGGAGVGIIIFLVGLVIGGSCIAAVTVGTVDTKKVGVVTSYKKPTGEIKEAGVYTKAPWKSITEMDAAIQTGTYVVNVQLVGGAKADVDVYPNWQMKPEAAPELFQQFKSFDNVVQSLFVQQLNATANELFGTYNPLTNLDPKTGELKKTKGQWATELKTALENNPLIKDKLIINNISIPTIAPDQGTQDNLNKIVAEFAKGSLLEQQKLNALKEKEITETNAKVDPRTRCLEIASRVGTNPGACMGGNSLILNDSK